MLCQSVLVSYAAVWQGQLWILLIALAVICQLLPSPCSASSPVLLSSSTGSVSLGTYIEMGDTTVELPPVTVGSGRRSSWWQAPIGDCACVPVSPVDAACLDVDIHGIYSDTLITLEGLLVGRLRVPREQAANLVVISNV